MTRAADERQRGHVHMALVQQLVSGGASRARFREALEKAYGAALEESGEILRERDGRPTVVIPDAFKIGPDSVIIYEVEVTSRMSRQKLDLYAELWFDLDCVEVDTQLVIVDRFGNQNHYDLCAHWYRSLPEQQYDA